MTRFLFSVSAIAALAMAVPAIAGNGDDANALINECSAPNLPPDAIDSCLERVRVMDETDPSPQIQSLEAMLEQRRSGGGQASAPPPPASYQQGAPVEQGAPIDVPSYGRPMPHAGGAPAQLGGHIQGAPMPPPTGGYQNDMSQPDEPFPQSGADEQDPADAQGGLDDQGPPDQQQESNDLGPADAGPQEDGPPTDERTPDDPDNGYGSQPPGE